MTNRRQFFRLGLAAALPAASPVSAALLAADEGRCALHRASWRAEALLRSRDARLALALHPTLRASADGTLSARAHRLMAADEAYEAEAAAQELEWLAQRLPEAAELLRLPAGSARALARCRKKALKQPSGTGPVPEEPTLGLRLALDHRTVTLSRRDAPEALAALLGAAAAEGDAAHFGRKTALLRGTPSDAGRSAPKALWELAEDVVRRTPEAREPMTKAFLRAYAAETRRFDGLG